MRRHRRGVNGFVKISVDHSLQRFGNRRWMAHPGKMIGRYAQLPGTEPDCVVIAAWQPAAQRHQRGWWCQPVVFKAYADAAELELCHVLLHLGRYPIPPCTSYPGPVCNQPAGFTTAKAQPSAGQVAQQTGEAGKQGVCQWQSVALWWPKAGPMWRAAGDQPQPLQSGDLAGKTAGELAAQAVSAQCIDRHPMSVQAGHCGRKVGGQQLGKSPVLTAAGAQLAAAMAAPFVQGHAAAALGQGMGKGQVVACTDSQCGQPQQVARRGCRRGDMQQFKAMPITGSDLQRERRGHRAAPI